ncbi:MAG: aldose 1-epimerase [Chitinophagaceae bacterium]|nr:MAG: aldose 1-epimerase [Chitinophagaceae bacterium]
MRFEVSSHNNAGFSVITLTDKESHCQAEIYAMGGLLNAFRIPLADGSIRNVVDGFANEQAAIQQLTNGFRSAKLSPFVCRMFKGSYQLAGHNYTTQKWYLGEHAIHGLLYDAVFTVTDTFASTEKAAVTLEYQYPGSDPGYPFPYTMLINWQLTAGNRLTVTTTVFHHNTAAIPIADGWHPYFTLGTPVDDYTLQFDSDTQLEYNADLLPTGKKITDTRFRNGCSLAGVQLDNSFELATDTAAAKCILQNGQLQLTIEPGKNYPILQVYIPAHRNSIAIENLSGAPDNFNNGMGLIMLAPNEQKVFRTSYRISNIEQGMSNVEVEG